MGVTLSHQSALDVTRQLRSEGANLQEMDRTTLSRPSPWKGNRWSPDLFEPSEWRWERPTATRPLHVMVPRRDSRLRLADVCVHTQWHDVPANSIVWLDERSSMVCPELLFMQMASTFSLPALVLLGHELCGHFSRCADAPLEGTVTLEMPAATSVEKIGEYLEQLKRVPGLAKAKRALRFIADHAVSAPEAVLATVYALPPQESGYGMGPILLNQRISVGEHVCQTGKQSRYPDLLFPFAPIGINYDGDGHLDLDVLAQIVQQAALATGKKRTAILNDVRRKKDEIRAKVVDDNRRNRQLAARGYIVFPATKEDLYGSGHLDALTREILSCAKMVFHTNTSKYENILDDTEKQRDRHELLMSLLPSGGSFSKAYGNI